MRTFWLIPCLLLCSISWLRAQVTVEVLLDQEQFLRDEGLSVKLRITNRSGRTLPLGKNSDWLSFNVESLDGSPVSRVGELRVQEEYPLESARTAVRQFDLLPYFDVSRPGRYTVTASVKIAAWGEEFTSAPKTFEITSGFKLWEQEFGVPGQSGPPEVRKYILQQAQYRKHLVLYLRVADAADSKVYRVFPIGPLVSFSRPEHQLDKDSNLHLLCQYGAWSFIYVVVDPQGTVLVRQRYDYTDTRPVLKPGENGKVVVRGGSRRITADDFPPVATETSTNDAPKAPIKP